MAISNTISTLTALAPIMKEQFAPKIQEIIEDKAILYKEFEKEVKRYGKIFYIPIEATWNRGIGASAEDGVLPAVGAAVPDRFELSPTYQWGGIGLTLQSIKESEGAGIAVETQMSFQMKSMRRAFTKELNRLFWGFDGRMGIVSSKTNATTWVMKAPDLARYFQINDNIQLSTGANQTPDTNGSGTVSAINLSTNTLTLSGAGITATGADGDYMYRSLAGTDQTSGGNYFNGLRHIVDDTTNSNNSFQSKTRSATTPLWNGNVLGNSGTNRALTQLLMDQAYDKSREQSPETAPDMLMYHTSVGREYRALLTPDIRYTSGEGMDPRKNPEYNGMKIISDVDAPYNNMFFLCRDSMKCYEAAPFTWYDDGGGVWQRQDVESTAPKANQIARAYIWLNIGVSIPAANTLLDDITATT